MDSDFTKTKRNERISHVLADEKPATIARYIDALSSN